MQAPVFREQSVQRAVSRGQDGGCMWPVASCVTLGETFETVMSKLITIINAIDTNPKKLTILRLTIGLGEVMLLILLKPYSFKDLRYLTLILYPTLFRTLIWCGPTQMFTSGRVKVK